MRRDAEDALRASEKDFGTLFEMGASGNVIAEARTGRFLRVNRRFCEMTGYTDRELWAMNSEELTHPDDVAHFRAEWKAAMRRRAGACTVVKRLLRKGGEILWVEEVSAFVDDTSGEPLHVFGVTHELPDGRRSTDDAEKVRREVEHAFFRGAEGEKQRIGRELHDHLCQQLLGAAFAVKAFAHHLDAGTPLATEAEALAQLINSTVQQTREIARGLNPAAKPVAAWASPSGWNQP